MIGCHRALGEGFTGKDSQTDVVVRSSRDEFCSHILSRFHTVRSQIFGKHRGGNVHCQHNVNAFHRLVVPSRMRLRTSHRTDDEHETDASQHHWQMDETHTQALRSILILFRVAHAHGWRILLPVEEIP